MSIATSDRIEPPEPEGASAREVFTFVGLALYAAQVLEAELINLAVGLLAGQRQSRVNRAEIEEWFTGHEQKTFGGLANAIRRLTPLNPSLESLISRALVARNRVAHDFFRDHAVNFMSDDGRRQMIDELRSMTRLFEEANAAGESIRACKEISDLARRS